jgi:hypothetical protein
MKTLLLITILAAGCGSDGGSSAIDDIDARCKALCADPDATCTAEISECEGACQVRISDMKPACATCLIERANAGTCSPGTVCCPDAEFPNSVIDCSASCADSEGVNPANHPVCIDLCADEDAACSTQAASCLAECNARVKDVRGLCALCLLEGAHNGACDGTPCCPDPQFPTSSGTCAAFCN